MCGGDLDVSQKDSTVTCPYCDTKQTVPHLDDDKRATLYDRADHFRRSSEFDKAAGIYDLILTEDPSDAEAYWLLVLCRYGVEYVKDPATHKMVPTVNRMQRISVSADGDFKQALSHAGSCQADIYQQEADAIDAIQKKALAISENEEPFDIFICFKETGAGNKRTKDSVRAQEIYQALTKEGYKVFFSRITLQGKPGTEYEPYIFAALNSAPVMIVVGTSKDNLEAAWVKNEWSRYLALMKEDDTKHLIPVYEDIDPYSLPEDFALLQALDMGTLGFIQDLTVGIGKMFHTDMPSKGSMTARLETFGGAAVNESALIKRARLCCEDGDWGKADDFIEQALNMNPENGEAYLIKLMTSRHCHLEEQLSESDIQLDGSPDYVKALRFGDAGLKECLTGYNEVIKRTEEQRMEEQRAEEQRREEQRREKQRIEEQRLEEERLARCEQAYQDLKDEMIRFFNNFYVKTSDSKLLGLAQRFEQLHGYKDADALSAKCTAEYAKRQAKL